jgi:hypothetical protein
MTQTSGWARLADALDKRRQDLGMTQAQVYAAGGPSKAWQAALRSREAGTPSVREQTMLPRLDRAVRWPDGTARSIVTGPPAPSRNATGTPTLSEFLLARIAEDEEWASQVGGPDYSEPYDPGAPAHHARILAECEAKRRIVERAASEIAKADAKDSEQIERSFDAGSAFFAHNTLLDLATPYADHPDYDEAWRP